MKIFRGDTFEFDFQIDLVDGSQYECQMVKKVIWLIKIINNTELEDLEITPSGVEQNFKSSKYGYDNVKVKAVESEEITITPSTEIQVKEGMFNKVTVIGDEELKAENIKEGINIFGVDGTAKTANAKITDATRLFYNNVRLDYLNELMGLCENVTSTNSMFYNSNSLTDLDLSNFDTSNITDTQQMFYGCSNLVNLNLNNFNTSKVRLFNGMFNGCSSLRSLDLSDFDTSNATNLTSMFSGCTNLASLNVSNFNTSKITNIGSMFLSCYNLTDLDLSNFDMSKVEVVSSILAGCNNLTNLKSFKNLGKAYTRKSTKYSVYTLDLSNCTKLTYESLMDIINNLYDLNLSYGVANGGTLYRQSLVLGSTNLAKLTADEIVIATNKGWTVT